MRINISPLSLIFRHACRRSSKTQIGREQDADGRATHVAVVVEEVLDADGDEGWVFADHPVGAGEAPASRL